MRKSKLLSLENFNSNYEYVPSCSQDILSEEKEIDSSMEDLGYLINVSVSGMESLGSKNAADLGSPDDAFTSVKELISLRGSLESKFPGIFTSVDFKDISFESLYKSPRTALIVSQEGILDVLKSVGRKIRDFIKMIIEKIKKLFSLIIRLFKGVERDIKEQDKNLSKNKFDIKDPSLGEKNTKYYSKKDVIDVLESKDERLAGFKDASSMFNGEVKDDLSLEELIKEMKRIVLSNDRSANEIKAELIAYINANITDKKIEERKNTIMDLDSLLEEISYFKDRFDSDLFLDGSNRKEVRESLDFSSEYGSHEVKEIFRFMNNKWVGEVSNTWKVFDTYLIKKETYEGHYPLPIVDPNVVITGDLKTGERVHFIAPVDDPSVDKIFDKVFCVKSVYNERRLKFEDPVVVPFEDFKNVVDASEVKNLRYFILNISSTMNSLCRIAKEVISKSKDIETMSRKTLEEFEKEYVTSVVNFNPDFYGVNGSLNKVRDHGSFISLKNGDLSERESYETIKTLVKIFYDLVKYWLRFPLGVKRSIDVYREILNNSITIKVKG